MPGQSAASGPPASVSNEASDLKLEEIIVTAQKRAERLIDVPVSIVAVSADELKQRQITSLEDLPFIVPDLSILKNGNGDIFEIRGISNSSGNASLVGMYIDEADVTLGGGNSYDFINPVAYDLERVEVLRGPQGTLYGDGSAGGTIRFITKNPNLTTLSFGSDVAALFTQDGAPSQRINAVINVPLIEDQLGLRIASTFQHDGGWINQPAADQKDINSQDLTNVRIKALWKPADDLTVSAMAVVNRDERSLDFSDVGTPYAYTQMFNQTTTPRLRSDYDLYNLTVTYDLFSVARVLNTTTYLGTSQPEWNVGYTDQLTPPGTPAVDNLIQFEQSNDHLLTDELRLTSLGSGRLQWTVGEFFRHYRDYANFPVIYFGPAGPPGTPLPVPYGYGADTLYKSWSTFGDANYRFTDRLTVGAGIRDFSEHQDFTSFPPVAQQTGDFHSVDPRVYAQFKITPDANIYTSAAKGFRTGGFNAFNQPKYEPESVWTYELGTKMTLLEGRISLDTDLFFSNYQGYQTYGISPVSEGVPIDSNAGRARVKGIESDLTWRPLPGWRLDARGDYVNARFTEIDATASSAAPGDPLDLVPRYQFTVSGQREFSLLGKAGSARLDYNQQGPTTQRNLSIGPWFYGESDIIHTLNFNTNVVLNDNLTVGFFAQNLLNDQGFVNSDSFISSGVRSRPRTFGVNFSVSE